MPIIYKTKRIAIFLLSTLLAFSLFCQTNKLTIKDAVWGRFFQLKPEDLNDIEWRNNNEFTFVKNNEIRYYNVTSHTFETLFTLSELNNILKIKVKDSLFSIKNIEWINENEFYIERYNKYYLINVNEKQLTNLIELPEKAENIEICNSTGNIAYTLTNNVYYISRDNKQIAITHEENTEIVYGQAVHRHEFGINKGIFWSPDGNFIAFYRKDESMVTDYPLVNTKSRIAELKNIKYPMAGMNSHEVTIGIYSLKNKAINYLKTGKPKDQYLTNICWAPNEKFLYVAHVNRDQNYMKLNKYNINNGYLVNTLFEERNEKYVEPLNPVYFIQNQTGRFIWQSRRDGYNHLYLYQENDSIIKQLTNGNWEVIKLLGSNSKYAYFTATKESPLDQHIYKVNINNSEIIKITNEKGIHLPIPNKNYTYIIDRFSNINVSNKINIINTSTFKAKDIITSHNPLKDYNQVEIDISSLVTSDSVELFYRIIKPEYIDPKKKYPVIIYVYGGPHLQLIQNNWLGGATLWDYYMAQEGYIIFSIDNRGSANRGFEFESSTFRKLGQMEMKDQL